MQAIASGRVGKLVSSLQSPVSYALPLDDVRVDMNALLGRTVQLKFEGTISCINCNRRTSKSFSQGYCYPCFTRLAACDPCIVSPEKCHFSQGTCREPEWAQNHCMVEHIVYLANSSDLKVGITRATQLPTRWIDQGAIQALPVFRVATRQQSGLIEAAFRAHVADRTAWQKMLKGAGGEIDLLRERDRLIGLVRERIDELQQQFGLQAIVQIADSALTTITYPVLEYPTKIVAFNLDRNPLAEGTLLGIKGQYLIFDTGVINIRKYTAYRLSIAAA
jgi:hypothetical protein